MVHIYLCGRREKKDEQKDRAGYAVVLLLFLVFNSELQEDLHFQEESLSSKLNINKQLLHEAQGFFLSVRKISICVVRVADTETFRHEIFVPPPSTRSKNPPPSFFVFCFCFGGFSENNPKIEEM